MPKRKYSIDLSEKERILLRKIIKTGKSSARVILRANILLSSDINSLNLLTVAETAQLFETTSTTVQNVRTAFAENGIDAALYRKHRMIPPIPSKVDGALEAHIIAVNLRKAIPDGAFVF